VLLYLLQRSVKNHQKATVTEETSSVPTEDKLINQNGNVQAVCQVADKPTNENGKSKSTKETTETLDTVKVQQELKPTAESEASAIRARMLAKRRSTPLMDSKPKPYVPKISEDQLSFSELRASLGRVRRLAIRYAF
jgi:hypothetical protein